MRTQGTNRTGRSGSKQDQADAAREARAGERDAAAATPQGLLALQATVGNAVAVQMLRRAGLQDREEHRHDAGCGHEEAQRPTVQRSAVHDDLRTPGIQQRRGQAAGTDKGSGLKVSDPSDRSERAGEANARRVMAAPARTDVQRAPDPSGRPAPGAVVQRVGDPQEMLHETYWKEQMIASGRSLAEPGGSKAQGGKGPKGKGSGSKGAKGAKGAKESSGRLLKDILQKIGPELLAELAQRSEEAEAGQLKIYRTMDTAEAVEILAWQGKAAPTESWIAEAPNRDPGTLTTDYHAARTAGEIGPMPVSNHLGDEGQATGYFKRPTEQVMIEFTLKKGAHELLFSPKYMAIAGDSGTPDHIRQTRETESEKFPRASGGEGKLAGYIGVKSEAKEPFSLSLGNSDITRLLFQLFVVDIRVTKGEENLSNS
ncbi:hypothetical protein ACFWRV_17425 [Streptomyces sp. NPDC058576]|uniref:hypothetical protein n=1 Tax=Streptomyces sp. NPDC058576 TaxID=3346547 RepID=UPI003646181E